MTPQQPTSGIEVDSWGKWFRDSSDKFLLTVIIVVLLLFTLHIIHHAPMDQAQTQFLNGLTNTFSGALITLVTGAVLRKSTTASASTKDPDTGRPNSTTTVKEEIK